MSINREDFGVLYEVEAGSTKDIELIIQDADGVIQTLADTALYATGVVKIYKPDGTFIVTSAAVVFDDRPNGVIHFTINAVDNTNENAGNWIGNLEFINNTSQIIDQRKFNFNIIESF